jgi:hypothetical protein
MVLVGIGLSALLALVALLLGYLMCAQAPPQAPVRGWIPLALAVHLFGLVPLATGIIPLVAGAGQVLPAGTGAASVCWASVAGLLFGTGFLLGIRFLAKVAAHFGKRDLATNCTIFLVVVVLGNVASIGGATLAYHGLDATGYGGRTAEMLVIVPLMFLVVMFLWHFVLLRSVRRVIRQQMSRPSTE